MNKYVKLECGCQEVFNIHIYLFIYLCKGCLINNGTVRTAQRDGQVFRCLMSVEAGIPQFHESVCTTSVEVLWLLKPRFYCLLYICVHGEAPTFVCLFHWSERMIVTEGHVWTVGGNVEEVLAVAASHRVVLPVLGLALLWRRTIPRDNMARLSAFIAYFKCSRFSSQRSAWTLIPLGKQSTRRGLRRSKNIVSITLPALGMSRLFFCYGDADVSSADSCI